MPSFPISFGKLSFSSVLGQRRSNSSTQSCRRGAKGSIGGERFGLFWCWFMSSFNHAKVLLSRTPRCAEISDNRGRFPLLWNWTVEKVWHRILLQCGVIGNKIYYMCSGFYSLILLAQMYILCPVIRPVCFSAFKIGCAPNPSATKLCVRWYKYREW